LFAYTFQALATGPTKNAFYAPVTEYTPGPANFPSLDAAWTTGD